MLHVGIKLTMRMHKQLTNPNWGVRVVILPVSLLPLCSYHPLHAKMEIHIYWSVAVEFQS